MNVAVIGAGPAGLSAACRLARGGARVEIFESSDAVGGLARTLTLWGQRADLGPHRFFSDDARVNAFWREAVGDDFRMVDRFTRIYYDRKFFRYPLQPADALGNMGLVDAMRCVGSFLREKASPSRAPGGIRTFEGWVVSRFGRRLYEMFFKSYSEKLWGIPCGELDADFAAQRIKGFSLGEALRNAAGLGGKGHKTLVDRFAYPLGGAGMPYERMAGFVRDRGGTVRLRTPVRRVLHRDRRVVGVELDGGEAPGFDHVVSTMPLSLLVRGLGGLPPEISRSLDALEFRNTVIAFLLVDSASLFGDQWLYVHSPDLLTGRISNFRNWVPELYGDSGTTIVALEYWCYDRDAIWSEPTERIVERAAREIGATGLLGKARILDGCVRRLPFCYPVYRLGYREHVARIAAHLGRFAGLSVIGRSGAFKYNNQDHSILMGLLAADNLLEGAGHDLWSVNTDYDAYQEGARVPEALLPGKPPAGD